MVQNIQKYIFEKLFFPRVAVIDQPGIIISKTSSKYGSKTSMKRMVFYFEDIIANLQIETVKKIGKEKTSNLWYKIGKDAGTRYLLLSKAKKPPSFLMPSIIQYIFSNLNANGMSVCNKIIFDHKNNFLILTGKDNIIWRKTNEGSLFSGLVSGILSFLIGQNIEAENYYDIRSQTYKIIANKNIKKKYIPNLKNLTPLKEYNKLNDFLGNVKTPNLPSFSTGIKFKKIEVTEDGKFHLKNQTIIPSEIGLLELIIRYYEEHKIKELFEKEIVKSAEKVYEEIFENKNNATQNLKSVKKIFCILGLGILYYKIYKKEIIIHILNAPICKYGFRYHSLVLNGFLNKVFERKFKIERIKLKTNPVLIEIIYKDFTLRNHH